MDIFGSEPINNTDVATTGLIVLTFLIMSYFFVFFAGQWYAQSKIVTIRCGQITPGEILR